MSEVKEAAYFLPVPLKGIEQQEILAVLRGFVVGRRLLVTEPAHVAPKHLRGLDMEYDGQPALLPTEGPARNLLRDEYAALYRRIWFGQFGYDGTEPTVRLRKTATQGLWVNTDTLIC